MAMPLLARLFRGKREAHEAEEEIVLADFNLRPATTIDVTPGAVEPPLATVVAESARPAGQSELSSVVERLAEGMVEAWNGVVRDMQGMLAADHASMEVATAEMRRMTEELGRVSEELTQIRRRLDAQAEVLRALHSTTEAQAARVTEIVAAVRKFGESLVD
jgi:septal ring factor EnvC (AmiA/AmiB activator)